MVQPFERFNEILDLLVAGPEAGIQRDWRNRESLSGLRIPAGNQPLPQQPVDGALEGVSRAADFLLNELGDIVVDGESGSHIMMLIVKAS